MVRADPVVDKIAHMVTPLLDSMGLRLWGVAAGLAGRTQLVQVFVEGADSAASVDIDRLAEVSRHLGLMLDVDDAFSGPYRLEVSSPGFERPFFRPEQMAAYVGQMVEVRTQETLVGLEYGPAGRKVFRGSLEAVNGNDLLVLVDGTRFTLPWDQVRRAKLVVEDPWQYAKEHGPKASPAVQTPDGVDVETGSRPHRKGRKAAKK